MSFGNPQYFWFLFLLPSLGLFFMWVALRKRQALAQFAGTELADKLTQGISRTRQRSKVVLFVAGSLFLLLALTGPQLGAKLSMASHKGVEVVVVLDVSRSMQAQDLQPSRLQRAKYQVGELIDQLPGDRIGLVGFAGLAQIVCPLTLDHGALRLFLEVLDSNFIPVQGTALADALRTAARCFDAGSASSKAVVLFTDGEDHLGTVLETAEELAELGIRVFAVGMGTQGGELIPEEGDGGLNYHKDAEGNYVKTRLDEGFLKQLTLATDGDYYRTSLDGGELERIYEGLQELEQKEFGSNRFTEFEERYQSPLFVALLLFTTELLLSERRRQKAEWRGRFE